MLTKKWYNLFINRNLVMIYAFFWYDIIHFVSRDHTIFLLVFIPKSFITLRGGLCSYKSSYIFIIKWCRTVQLTIFLVRTNDYHNGTNLKLNKDNDLVEKPTSDHEKWKNNHWKVMYIHDHDFCPFFYIWKTKLTKCGSFSMYDLVK